MIKSEAVIVGANEIVDAGEARVRAMHYYGAVYYSLHTHLASFL